jgi:signal transduction histidine kinase
MVVTPLPLVLPAVKRSRRLAVVLAGIGVVMFLVGTAANIVHGDLEGVGWNLIGPLPFVASGLLLAVRRPGWPVATWLLGVGAAFMVSVAVGDSLLPALAAWPAAWILALVRDWGGTGSTLSALGLIGLFPTGLPARHWERSCVRGVAVAAALVPVFVALTRPTFTAGTFPNDLTPVIASPLYVPGLAGLGGLATVASMAFPELVALGLLMLFLRYRRGDSYARRRIRWPLIGLTAGLALWVATFMVAWLLAPDAAATVAFLLWPISLLLELGSLLVASTDDGLLGIDRPARRAVVYRALRIVIAVAYVASAAVLGVLASRVMPIGVAILLAAAFALLFQPLQRKLERVADRWAFGARLDGYDVLARLGAVLESAPEPLELLPTLTETVRQGLGLTWVRVRLDLPTDPDTAAQATDGLVTGDPVLSQPLLHAGRVLGHIDCGPRRDHAIIDADRRLLAQLAAQAAVAVHERYLSIELAARLAVIERQADELAASRSRVAQAQDAERRRLQRDLHDGVQQEVVALAAKLAIARQRLRRGQTAGDVLDALQQDLHNLVSHVREFAHTIHPPVLADRGLLEAVEAHASKLPLAVVIEADPALRGVHYPEPIEAAAWYLVGEALTNVVKHAQAHRIVIAVADCGGSLVVEVRDDGRGFDPGGPQGLGLAGLADRMDIVGGTLHLHSAVGTGTSIRAELPLPVSRHESGPDHG